MATTIPPGQPEAGTIPEYLITPEVAELFRTTPETVRYWRHIGYGPTGVKVGHRVLYAREDVLTWLRDLRAAAGATGAA